MIRAMVYTVSLVSLGNPNSALFHFKFEYTQLRAKQVCLHAPEWLGVRT